MCTQAGIAFIMCKISSILNATIPVLVTLGVVYLVWGIVQYFIGNSEEAMKKGRDRIVFGISGLAIILVLWGLVYLLINTFQVGGGRAPTGEEINKILLPQQP